MRGMESFNDTDVVCGPGRRSGYSDLLWFGRSGHQIYTGARFTAPVQKVPGAHPTSYTMDTGSFPGI